jgi:hypothetical protein
VIEATTELLRRQGAAELAPRATSVYGDRSGPFPHSTPVQLVLDDDRGHSLVAPYGERQWVKNARAAGEVALTRAGLTTRYWIEEVGPEEAAPVLREYLRTTPIVEPYFDVDAGAPLEAFAAEAARHPVFRLVENAKL